MTALKSNKQQRVPGLETLVVRVVVVVVELRLRGLLVCRKTVVSRFVVVVGEVCRFSVVVVLVVVVGGNVVVVVFVVVVVVVGAVVVVVVVEVADVGMLVVVGLRTVVAVVDGVVVVAVVVVVVVGLLVVVGDGVVVVVVGVVVVVVVVVGVVVVVDDGIYAEQVRQHDVHSDGLVQRCPLHDSFRSPHSQPVNIAYVLPLVIGTNTRYSSAWHVLATSVSYSLGGVP